MAELQIKAEVVGLGGQRQHVRIQMGDRNSERTRALDLGAGFALDLGERAVQQLGVEWQIAVGVQQTGDYVRSGNWPPAEAGPFTIEREMNAQIGLGMRLGPADNFRKPGAWDHHAGGSDPAFFQSLKSCTIDRVRHA